MELTVERGYCENCGNETEKTVKEEQVTLHFRGHPTEFQAPVARCSVCGEKMYDEQCSNIALAQSSQVYMNAMDYSTAELNKVLMMAVQSGMSMKEIHAALNTEKKWLDQWQSGKVIPTPDSIKLIKELKAKLQNK